MRKVRRFIRRAILFFFVSSILSVFILKYIPVYFTPLMVIRSFQQVVNNEKPNVAHKWVSSHDISDNMKRAVIASEDQRFYIHKGIDKVAIERAIEDNKSRKRVRGGSTISQQTAKNVFLWPQSSWLRKGLEAYFTILIEIIWSKERILEVYLNSIETGSGIYGVEAVAKEHFQTSANKLSASQSALIAATLPNPLIYNSKYPSEYMKKRQSHILKQMKTVKLPD